MNTPLLVAAEAETGAETIPVTEVIEAEEMVTEDAMVVILVMTTVEVVAEDAAAVAVVTEDIVEARTEVVAIGTTGTTVTGAAITEGVDRAAALALSAAEGMAAPLAAALVE